MFTITFYSYKGGSGRTLLVANTALFLSRFGKRVVALDFDLEAPGLHYKFFLTEGRPVPTGPGVVDYVHAFYTEGRFPERLADYAITVPGLEASDPPIHIMPSGNALSTQYWRNLSRINWHGFLYDPHAQGIPFFLEFKERIRKEFAPDVLLIDARTGVTEIGGVATTILADEVVCLMSSSRENLDGARSVLRSVRRGPRPPGASPVEIMTILSRFGPMDDTKEEELCVTTRDFLNEHAVDVEDTLNIADVFKLHSEPELEVAERLLVGEDKTHEESVLRSDYLLLFPHIIPAHLIKLDTEEDVPKGKLLERMVQSLYDAALSIWESLPAFLRRPLWRVLHTTGVVAPMHLQTIELLQATKAFYRMQRRSIDRRSRQRARKLIRRAQFRLQVLEWLALHSRELYKIKVSRYCAQATLLLQRAGRLLGPGHPRLWPGSLLRT